MKQLTSAAAAVVALLLMLSFNLNAGATDTSLLVRRPPQVRRSKKSIRDYSQFLHRTHLNNEKTACDSCHKFPTDNWKTVRAGDAAFPDVAEFPEHGTCLNCHRQQFFARQRPAPAICSNCHVNATPRDTARFLFPSLGDVTDGGKSKKNNVAEFKIEFPHDKHEDQECVVCHKTEAPEEGAKINPRSHGVCFSCHNVESELSPAPSACNKCHKLQLTPAITQRATHPPATAGGTDLFQIRLINFEVNATQQMKVPDDADYSKFQHESAYHQRLPCLLCHRRDTDATRPTMPGGKDHKPCAGCHVKQFADRSGPICANCHTEPSSGALKAFPKLSSFTMKFDHARHTGVTCANCHRPARGGVALTIPVGPNAHATCFQCHGPQSKAGDRDISSCGVCHEIGRYTRPSQSARAFKVGFSHAQHNRDEGLSCSVCHNVRGGLQTNEVSAPQPLNHHAKRGSLSCMSCHNGKRAFGGDDFSSCKRCHQGSAWHF